MLSVARKRFAAADLITTGHGLGFTLIGQSGCSGRVDAVDALL
jgi:hypothetical protein